MDLRDTQTILHTTQFEAGSRRRSWFGNPNHKWLTNCPCWRLIRFVPQSAAISVMKMDWIQDGSLNQKLRTNQSWNIWIWYHNIGCRVFRATGMLIGIYHKTRFDERWQETFNKRVYQRQSFGRPLNHSFEKFCDSMNHFVFESYWLTSMPVWYAQTPNKISPSSKILVYSNTLQQESKTGKINQKTNVFVKGNHWGGAGNRMWEKVTDKWPDWYVKLLVEGCLKQ